MRSITQVLVLTAFLMSMVPFASAHGFAETANLDSIGVAIGVAVDNNRNFAGTIALAPNGVMDANVNAAVGSNGAAVSQSTLASGSQVFAGSMAGDLDEAQGCFLTTTSQAYTDVQVTNGGLATLQGANTISGLNAAQQTLAQGNDVSTDTYAENENGLSDADSSVTNGVISCVTAAHSDDSLTSSYSANSIQGLDGEMNCIAVVYNGPSADAHAWYNGAGSMNGAVYSWQNSVTSSAFVL